MRTRENGRDLSTNGTGNALDTQLQNVLIEDREVLREEHDADGVRARVMGVLAASAMPAGGNVVGTQSWIAKLVSSKIFLSSFLGVVIVGGTVVGVLSGGEKSDSRENQPAVMMGESQPEAMVEEEVNRPLPVTIAEEEVSEAEKNVSSYRHAQPVVQPPLPTSSGQSHSESQGGGDAQSQSTANTQEKESLDPVVTKVDRADVNVKINPVKEE